MAAIIQTEAGRIHGSSENGLSVYRGVPFAAPPVGELRFRVARPHPGWDDVLDCESFRPISPQVPNEALDSMLGLAPQEQSEDCLFLNIWTPGTDAEARPVMVWIHGGAFTIGSGSDGLYNGAMLASRGDVVVVTINYRLGALGFLHLPALDESNFGMRDQVAALRWVRDNIASFGGDPGNIMIFGESAGGMSVAFIDGFARGAGVVPQSDSTVRCRASRYRRCPGGQLMVSSSASSWESIRKIRLRSSQLRSVTCLKRRHSWNRTCCTRQWKRETSPKCRFDRSLTASS